MNGGWLSEKELWAEIKRLSEIPKRSANRSCESEDACTRVMCETTVDSAMSRLYEWDVYGKAGWEYE